MDPMPVDITERLRLVTHSQRAARAEHAAAKERMRRQPISKRSAAKGKAAKVLRGQR